MLINNELHDFEGDLDMANLRTVSLKDGTVAKITRMDPYGLIEITFEGKPTPEILSGKYTSYEYAKDAIAKYQINNPSTKKKR